VLISTRWFVFYAKLPVSGGNTAYVICRWYSCTYHFSILLTSHINQKFEPVDWKKKVSAAIAVIAGAIVCLTGLSFIFISCQSGYR